MKIEDKQKRELLMLGVAVLTVLLLLFGRNQISGKGDNGTTVVDNKPPQAVSEPAVAELVTPEPTENPENGVYSYLQGPKSWKERREWSGKWGTEYHDGSSFGAFGCGFCAMANIYSTLTEYKCTPLDMYAFSKKNTYYGGGGAISWQFMRKTMAETGFSVRLGEKPSTYENFCAAAEEAQAMLVLVSSYNDDSYWKDTPGHYVTLFLYDKESQKVFLTDSGDPEHNRHWVRLKTIYKALKTSSDFQYMSILGYEKEKDTWRHKTATGTWIEPSGLR